MKNLKINLLLSAFVVIAISAIAKETSKKKMRDDFEQYKKNRMEL